MFSYLKHRWIWRRTPPDSRDKETWVSGADYAMYANYLCKWREKFARSVNSLSRHCSLVSVVIFTALNSMFFSYLKHRLIWMRTPSDSADQKVSDPESAKHANYFQKMARKICQVKEFLITLLLCKTVHWHQSVRYQVLEHRVPDAYAKPGLLLKKYTTQQTKLDLRSSLRFFPWLLLFKQVKKLPGSYDQKYSAFRVVIFVLHIIQTTMI
jgi:hypothetical protein